MKKIKQIMMIGAISCFLIVSSAYAVDESDITITQEQSILSMEFHARLNITVAFYDEHQVYVSEAANITDHYNCSIPDRLSVTGGYYRVADITTEQINSQEFVSIVPWEPGDGGYNPPPTTTESTIEGVAISPQLATDQMIGGAIAVGLTVSGVIAYYVSKGEKK